MKHIFKKNSVTVATYHFIRKNNDLKYKNINYLELNKFKKEINFFKKKFSIINFEDLLEVLNSKKIYKKPFLVLTFDDGYIDHYKHVFPILLERGIQGTFFTPSAPLLEGIILDVNKIQFLVTQTQLIEEIVVSIKKYILHLIKQLLIRED